MSDVHGFSGGLAGVVDIANLKAYPDSFPVTTALVHAFLSFDNDFTIGLPSPKRENKSLSARSATNRVQSLLILRSLPMVSSR